VPTGAEQAANSSAKPGCADSGGTESGTVGDDHDLQFLVKNWQKLPVAAWQQIVAIILTVVFPAIRRV
jgi:hypothetical protein